jgi:hypothetical protein
MGMSPFITKAGTSPIPYIGNVSFYYKSRYISHSVYRETSIRMAHLCFIPPYKAHSQLGQNNGGARSCPVLAISFPFWMKYNSYGDEV